MHDTLDQAQAATLLQESRFATDARWQSSDMAQALAGASSGEAAAKIANALRAFLLARACPEGIDRFLKLWTSLNALCGYLSIRFMQAQAKHLRTTPEKLPARYQIGNIDNATQGALSVLIDPDRPLPYFTVVNSEAFVSAYDRFEALASDILDELDASDCRFLSILADSEAEHVAAPGPACEELLQTANSINVAPTTFVLLVASYRLRNGYIHGSLPLPLLPEETDAASRAAQLCSVALDEFLDASLPVAVQHLQAPEGTYAQEDEERRARIEQYLDHRFDGMGLGGLMLKHGLSW